MATSAYTLIASEFPPLPRTLPWKQLRAAQVLPFRIYACHEISLDLGRADTLGVSVVKLCVPAECREPAIKADIKVAMIWVRVGLGTVN